MNKLCCVNCADEISIYPIFIYKGSSYCRDCLDEFMDLKEKKGVKK